MDIVLEALDSIKESDRKFFEQTEEGKFKFNRDKYDNAVKSPLLQKRDELLAKQSKYKDLDDADLARIARLKAKTEKLGKFDDWLEAEDEEDHGDDDKKDKSKDGGFDQKAFAKQLKADLQKEFDAKLKAKDDEIKARDERLQAEQGKFEGFKFDARLTEAAENGGIVRMKQFKALNAIDRQFGWKAGEDGKEGRIVALDEDGEESTDTVDERFKALFANPEWQNLFGAREPGGGSGMQKGKSASGNVSRKRSEMTSKQKSDYIKEHGGGQKGLDAFLKLPK